MSGSPERAPTANTAAEALELLRSRIDEANRLVLAAQGELDEALKHLTPVQIGDKGMTTEALEKAFEKLKVARELVSKLAQQLISTQREPARP